MAARDFAYISWIGNWGLEQIQRQQKSLVFFTYSYSTAGKPRRRTLGGVCSAYATVVKLITGVKLNSLQCTF
jgi:hypothetical protein